MSLLETTLNTRDLGGHKTNVGKVTIFNRIYRSDYGNKPPNDKDIKLLLINKITTIIDMRYIQNKDTEKNYFAKLKDFKYYNYPIEEGSQIPKSINDVPKSYIDIACSKNIKNILEIIANSENGVMINCSAGKDRTGVVTAIIFMLCGVIKDEIIKDYMISKECLKEKFAEIKEKNPNIDINIIIPHESYIIDFMELFYKRFGDINNYINLIGLSINDRKKIQNKLLNPD